MEARIKGKKGLSCQQKEYLKRIILLKSHFTCPLFFHIYIFASIFLLLAEIILFLTISGPYNSGSVCRQWQSSDWIEKSCDANQVAFSLNFKQVRLGLDLLESFFSQTYSPYKFRQNQVYYKMIISRYGFFKFKSSQIFPKSIHWYL